MSPRFPRTRPSEEDTGRSAADARLALYNAARVAIQHNPPAKVLYERLRTHGEPHKVAMVAVMRKLLTILNAMLKTQTDWIGKTA